MTRTQKVMEFYEKDYLFFLNVLKSVSFCLFVANRVNLKIWYPAFEGVG